MVDGYPYPSLGAGTELSHVKKTFQQHQWTRFAVVAQGQGVFAVEQGKAIGLGQRGHHLQKPMSIAIGLNHRHRTALGGVLFG